MIIKTFENGDYITLEKDWIYGGVWWSSFYDQTRETYTKYDKDGNFICSWWEYLLC